MSCPRNTTIISSVLPCFLNETRWKYKKIKCSRLNRFRSSLNWRSEELNLRIPPPARPSILPPLSLSPQGRRSSHLLPLPNSAYTLVWRVNFGSGHVRAMRAGSPPGICFWWRKYRGLIFSIFYVQFQRGSCPWRWSWFKSCHYLRHSLWLPASKYYTGPGSPQQVLICKWRSVCVSAIRLSP